MAFFDMPVEALRTYLPELEAPADLRAFWSLTNTETRAFDLDPRFVKVESGLAIVETFDVRFRGFGGSEVRGWLHLPAHRDGTLPAVVEYLGYGGGRGLAHERVLWATAGYAHLIMDTRGQGGDTADPQATGGPAAAGFLTQGILDPATYFYRRVFADAVRAIEAVRAHDAVDGSRVAVAGTSQGGGIAIAAAAFGADLVGLAADVPFLCHFDRAIRIIDTDPYREIVRYLSIHRDQVARVLATLAYFDGAVLGRCASVPAIFSVALMDQSCPASTVYAAYNHYGGPKEIREYPFNGHEGGLSHHEREKLAWFRARFADPRPLA